jgi:hypothetical protein
MELQQQQSLASPAKQVPRSSLKMASNCLKKYSNQPLPKSALGPFAPTAVATKRKATKKSSHVRRRSSLEKATASLTSRRGHSDVALSTSSGATGLSHLRAGSKKKMSRSISWDVRPPRVHEIKKTGKKDDSSMNDMMDDDRNESWYSVCSYR